VATLFTKIIDGDIPGVFVWRDDVCVSFLSINPITPGHALVVPRAEVDHWLDLPESVIAHVGVVAQRIGRAQQVAFGCTRVGLIVAGFEVPHTHVHVIPMEHMGHLSFEHAAASVTRAELDDSATRIRAALRSAGEVAVSD
jgi:histidine triad (HIT) family protein